MTDAPPTDDGPPPVNLGMICTCDSASLAKADVRLERVIARLASGSRTFHPHPVTLETFLTEICRSLASMGANVGAIHVDQWFLVVVEGITQDNWDAEVTAECDRVVDGLAACWEFVAAGGFRRDGPPPSAPE